jgi:3-hydroxybutyryl-CoA dehydrogenase
VTPGAPLQAPARVGVVGCGLMGSGIVEVSARAGLEVVAVEVHEEALERGRARVEASLARGVKREKLTGDEAREALGRIHWSIGLEALEGCELVVEAVVEDAGVKGEIFRRLAGVVGPEVVLATNTSSLPVAELAGVTEGAERVVGLHFFNPVPVMALVEVITTPVTSERARALALAYVEALGKEGIPVPDLPGFVVNRLLVPFLMDAIREVERGLAPVDALDRAMVLGCGHPMGPLALCDFVGNDTLLRIGEILFREYGEARFAPPPLLRRVVALGRTGKKSGKGFYDWTGEDPVPLTF